MKTLAPSNRVIQGLWIGPSLSVMEQLSIMSFLAAGHEYHLFVYDTVSSVPPGTIVKDANQILPSSMIFRYRDHDSYAGFANFFRYKLLVDKGGWWVDLDTVCLKAFDFEATYVFSTELTELKRCGLSVNSGIIKAPPASPVLSFAWNECQSRDPEKLVWGETGPRLMAQAVEKFKLQHYAMDWRTFCPVPTKNCAEILSPEAQWVFGESTYAVHFWNEHWRRNGWNKDMDYHQNCVYERLKTRFFRRQELCTTQSEERFG